MAFCFLVGVTLIWVLGLGFRLYKGVITTALLLLTSGLETETRSDQGAC